MKLYNTLIILTCALSPLLSRGQQSYQLKGQVHAQKEVAKVYLYQVDKKRRLIDSADVIQGQFVLKGQVAHPISASIQIKGIRSDQSFYLENAHIDIQLYENRKRPNTVIGGTENSIRKSFESDSRYLMDTISKIGRSYEKSDEEGKVQLGIQLQELNKDLDSIRTSYLMAYPGSLAVLDWFRPYLPVMNYKQLEDLDTKFDKSLATQQTHLELQKYLKEKKEKYLVGQKAPKIISKTKAGKPFSLEQMKGKLILLDFWASWCAPCRIANRKLVATYQKYKTKGFEVVSYSLDHKEKLWLDAIQKDGIPWTQVSDLSGFDNNSVAQSYFVKQLPTLFLIDENGTVIQQHLDHEQLLAYLKKKYDHN